MLKKVIFVLFSGSLAACGFGGAEDTYVWLSEKSASKVVVGIHISLLNHPVETHDLGYAKMQRFADQACAEYGKSAKYTGDQVRKTLGNSYDTWLERSYTCT